MAKKVNPVGLTLKEYGMKTKVKKFDFLRSTDGKGISGLRMNSVVFNFRQVKEGDEFLKNVGSCMISEGRDESFFLNHNGRETAGSGSL